MRQGRIVRDMGTHYFRERHHWRTGEVLPTKQRVNRYLCIGGPHAGAYRSGEELVEDGNWDVYVSYNAAGGRRGKNNHSMVFLSTDLLT